ncbi:MAG: hypothetical protein E7617_06950 [Ruminococcaceae bacterium]|nr:hypothetical protein [Oscillospiraceae bacterium]
MSLTKIQHNIASSLTPEEAIGRLNKIVDPYRHSCKPFIGQVTGNRFKMRKKRRRFVRNSFRPVLVGRIEPGKNGSDIYVTARVNRFISLFVFLWSFFVVVFSVAAFFAEAVMILAGVFMMAFLGLLLWLGFYIPAKKALAILDRTLIK